MAARKRSTAPLWSPVAPPSQTANQRGRRRPRASRAARRTALAPQRPCQARDRVKPVTNPARQNGSPNAPSRQVVDPSRRNTGSGGSIAALPAHDGNAALPTVLRRAAAIPLPSTEPGRHQGPSASTTTGRWSRPIVLKNRARRKSSRKFATPFRQTASLQTLLAEMRCFRRMFSNRPSGG